MTAPTLAYHSVVDVFTADGTWYKPVGLAYAIVVLTGGGGGGGWATSGIAGIEVGGGGGGALRSKPIPASLLPDAVQIVVGAGGVYRQSDGGDSWFGADYRAPGGQCGEDHPLGGMGGVSPLRGGQGGAGSGAWGEAVTALPAQLLCGGGGGAGVGDAWGGQSGMNLRSDGTTTTNAPLLWPGVHQAGHGGAPRSGGAGQQFPQWPAGGGGARQDGAAGSVAIIQVVSNITDIT
ncbi:glycine-rich domain-containing protein [Tomitella gaofuii]|uniref:glycine-rich domain-containing protein n=1 Tax=Tomitella gaofuii TaxID=2760083 RepID=UPI0015F89E7C|nr:hypothetical protein [Tomitella gaofuii]